jgi:O-antigen ligase
MVIDFQAVNSLAPLALVTTEEAEPLLEQLDPPRRAIVLMALLALVLVGLFLVAFVMIGARWVRRLAGRGLRRTDASKPARDDSWRSALRDALPNGKTDATVSLDKPSDETRVDE